MTYSMGCVCVCLVRGVEVSCKLHKSCVIMTMCGGGGGGGLPGLGWMLGSFTVPTHTNTHHPPSATALRGRRPVHSHRTFCLLWYKQAPQSLTRFMPSLLFTHTHPSHLYTYTAYMKGVKGQQEWGGTQVSK